jgi:ATP-dependent Clp protease ATP-binding subunit ClpX
MREEAKPQLLKCSFCSKSEKEVNKLIAGPAVFICDECVDVCNQILSKENRRRRPSFVKRLVSKIPWLIFRTDYSGGL